MKRKWAAWSRGNVPQEEEYPVLIHCCPVEKASVWEYEISDHRTIPCHQSRRFPKPVLCHTGIPQGYPISSAHFSHTQTDFWPNYLDIWRSKHLDQCFLNVSRNFSNSKEKKELSKGFWWCLKFFDLEGFNLKNFIVLNQGFLSSLFTDYANHLEKCCLIVGSVNICSWVNRILKCFNRAIRKNKASFPLL